MTERFPADPVLPPEYPVVRHLFHAAQLARQAMDVFVPLLMWYGGDGPTSITMLGHEHGQLPVVLDETLDLVEKQYGRPVWFAVVVDAYGRITAPDSDITAEQLTERFVMGDPAVVEQLMMFVVCGGVQVWRVVYRFAGPDGWEWDEPELMLYPVLPNSDLLEVLQRRSGAARLDG